MTQNNKKTDRRVKYTKLALKEALIELLKQKSIDKISVKELCEVADINRSTFYAHYADQYSLLHQIEQEVLDGINHYLSDFNFESYEDGSIQVMNRIFDYIVENADLCKVILGESGDIALQKKIMMIVMQHGVPLLREQKGIDEKTLEYVYLFCVTGSIGVVQKWLQTGMQETSREMAELINRTSYQGFSAYLEK